MNGQLQVESGINQGTKFSLILNYPLKMADGTKEGNTSSNRTSAMAQIAKTDISDERVPITVLGNTTTYITTPAKAEVDKDEEKKDYSVQNVKTRDVNTVKPVEPQKRLRILYAEVNIFLYEIYI